MLWFWTISWFWTLQMFWHSFSESWTGRITVRTGSLFFFLSFWICRAVPYNPFGCSALVCSIWYCSPWTGQSANRPKGIPCRPIAYNLRVGALYLLNNWHRALMRGWYPDSWKHRLQNIPHGAYIHNSWHLDLHSTLCSGNCAPAPCIPLNGNFWKACIPPRACCPRHRHLQNGWTLLKGTALSVR